MISVDNQNEKRSSNILDGFRCKNSVMGNWFFSAFVMALTPHAKYFHGSGSENSCSCRTCGEALIYRAGLGPHPASSVLVAQPPPSLQVGGGATHHPKKCTWISEKNSAPWCKTCFHPFRSIPRHASCVLHGFHRFQFPKDFATRDSVAWGSWASTKKECVKKL